MEDMLTSEYEGCGQRRGLGPWLRGEMAGPRQSRLLAIHDRLQCPAAPGLPRPSWTNGLGSTAANIRHLLLGALQVFHRRCDTLPC